MTVHFVLVEPRLSENVGAAARAIKTMGFDSLRLIDPCDYLGEKGRILAHGSLDILEGARVCTSLEEALEDVDFAVATTARMRRLRSNYCDSDALLELVKSKGDSVQSLAMVFGPEDRGLRSKEILRCNATTSVPMAQSYPSLNLAQAVMVYAHALSPLILRSEEAAMEEPEEGALRALNASVRELLQEIGFKKSGSVYNRILERFGLLTQVDAHLVLSVCRKLKWTLDHPKKSV
jgi:tRNA/rRNA methyltransferase